MRDMLQHTFCLNVSRIDTTSCSRVVHRLNDLAAKKIAYEVISDSNL